MKDTNNEFKRLFFILVATIILCLYLTLFTSCSTTKNKVSESFEKSVSLDSVIYYRQERDSFNLLLEKSRSEKKTGITFSPTKLITVRDTVISVPDCENTIEITKDGIKATGNIESFSQDLVEIQDRLSVVNEQLETEIGKRIKVEEELREAKSVKQKKVRNLWWLFFVGYGLCVVMPPKRIFSLIKKALQ